MNFWNFLIVCMICRTLISITEEIRKSVQAKYKFEKDLEREEKEDE